MTSTQTTADLGLDPRTMTTPKTASRLRRGIDLPATVTVNDDGTETVNRIVAYDGLSARYEPAYKVAAGWGRIAAEQEVEVADATQRRRWTIANLATAAILAIPGYKEMDS